MNAAAGMLVLEKVRDEIAECAEKIDQSNETEEAVSAGLDRWALMLTEGMQALEESSKGKR